MRFVVAMSAVLLGCVSPATELVVVVDTDLPIPTSVNHVEVAVTGPDGMTQRESTDLTDRGRLPLTLGVSPASDALGPIGVTARAVLDGTTIVERHHVTTLVRGERRMLVMHLAARCIATTCPTGQTCTEQGCRPEVTEPLPWTEVPPTLADAGSDAGRPIDGGDAPSTDTPLSPDAPPLCEDATDCDDGEECTTDTCTAEGCTHTPRTGGCDDRVFCNGLDTCDATGACTVHAGSPCMGATTCDEARSVCAGCGSDAECMGASTGAWGACTATDLCALTGTHSRMVRTFACVGGACTPTDSTESESCPRSGVDGTVCATRSCSGGGPCMGFVGECGESGVQDIPCFQGICRGGSCNTEPAGSMTIGCSIDTDGRGCGSGGGCSGWSGCTGFVEPCGTTGTQSRTCQDPGQCVSGSCSMPGPRVESTSCSRSTDGVSCGSDVCGGWGGCTYAGDCDYSGTRTRTCQPQVCSGGACSLGGGYDESDSSACDRNTDGWGCEDGNYCTYDSCYSGYCSSYCDWCSNPYC